VNVASMTLRLLECKRKQTCLRHFVRNAMAEAVTGAVVENRGITQIRAPSSPMHFEVASRDRSGESSIYVHVTTQFWFLHIKIPHFLGCVHVRSRGLRCKKWGRTSSEFYKSSGNIVKTTTRPSLQ